MVGVTGCSRVSRACLVLVLCSLASRAWAQPTSSQPDADGEARNRARDWMHDGNTQYRNGDVRGAREQYLKAWRMAKSFDVACNLGRAEFELGQFRDAAEHLDYCVRFHMLSSKPEVIGNEQQARDRLRQARDHVATLLLVSDANGADISVDNVSVGLAPLAAPVYLTPGDHVVRAQAEGHADADATVSLEAGTVRSLTLRPTPLSRARSPHAVPKSSQGESASQSAPRTRYLPWVAGGLAVVGLGTGIGLLASAAGKDGDKDDILRNLGEPAPCAQGSPHVSECSRAHDLGLSARTAREIGYTSLGVGAAAAVVAVIALVSPGASESPASSATQTRLLPSLTAERVWLSLQASF